MLTFSNPLLFWLLPILALPWLFRRRKEERIRHLPFPLIQFLRESEEKELINPHLQELLLLLLRTLLLGVLLFALAGPKWVSAPLPGAGLFSVLPIGKAFQSNTIVLDTSYSLGYREGPESWWSKAREAWKAATSHTRGFATTYVQWDRTTVIPSGSSPLPSLSTQEIEEIFLGMPREEGTPVLDLCTALTRSFEGRSNAIVITDGQRWPWESLLESQIHPAELPGLIVVPVGTEPVRNTWFQVESLSTPPWGISGWETFAGHVQSIQDDPNASGLISIFHGQTGEHLYSKTITYPNLLGQAAMLPFSFTALYSKLVQNSTSATNTPTDFLEFRVKLEPSDPLPIDNEAVYRVPVLPHFTVGITGSADTASQAYRVLSTAINPLQGSVDSPPVDLRAVSPAEGIPAGLDLLFTVPDFVPAWSGQDTVATIDYIKTGGNAVIITGGRPADSSPWGQLLAQIGWKETPSSVTEASLDTLSAGGTGLLGSALAAWDRSMWIPWLPSTHHGVITGQQAQPLVTYNTGESTCHLLTEISLGKGTGWLLNARLEEKSDILLSPLLPVLIWEIGKEAARLRQVTPLTLPRPRLESNLLLLTDQDKNKLQERYNIRFATVDTLRDEIAQLQAGTDLRMLLLFFCVLLALLESWLSNRMASM
ncbi:MAG: BatA domain-containing protein [bacterium]|jgi:hypothetical protein|nr:BatA domain-containing protein [bacterium]